MYKIVTTFPCIAIQIFHWRNWNRSINKSEFVLSCKCAFHRTTPCEVVRTGKSGVTVTEFGPSLGKLEQKIGISVRLLNKNWSNTRWHVESCREFNEEDEGKTEYAMKNAENSIRQKKRRRVEEKRK